MSQFDEPKFQLTLSEMELDLLYLAVAAYQSMLQQKINDFESKGPEQRHERGIVRRCIEMKQKLVAVDS